MIVLLIEIHIQTMRRSRLAQRTSALPRGRLMKARTAPATTLFHFAHAEAPPSVRGAATSHAPNRTLMNRHARQQSAAVSNPALRSEHGGREQRPDAERGAKRNISRRGHPKHWPQHLCRRPTIARRAIIFAAAFHRVVRPERAPELLTSAYASREELSDRDHLIDRQHDH
jgi:hypothetical protein